MSCDTVIQFFHDEWHIDKDALKPIIKKELDGDGDGTVTFKEFNKFFKQFQD